MNETLAVGDLARLCAEETTRYQRGQPYAERFCLELFRRAVVHRDDDAWAAIYEQYAGVVKRWLGAHEQSSDEGITDTFARFWRAVDGSKFARFGSLSAVLQYLKMCAQTAHLDRARASQAVQHEQSLDERIHILPSQENIEEYTAGRLEAHEFWRSVQEVVTEEGERTVIYLSYVMGLTPREICARHAAQFPDVADIYRLKRNALDRLRRSTTVKMFL